MGKKRERIASKKKKVGGPKPSLLRVGVEDMFRLFRGDVL